MILTFPGVKAARKPITGIMSALLLRVPAAYIFGLTFDWGLMGIGLAAPVASLGSTALATAYYLSGKWKISTVIKKS